MNHAKLKLFYRQYTHIIRGVLLFVLAQLSMGDLDSMSLWSKRRWAIAIGAALIGAMRAGEFNIHDVPEPKP